MYEPAIKWSGSKRSQAEQIISFFPKEIDTYYEPFCGSCAILRRLLDSSIKINHYVCSDLNNDLIQLWQIIKDNPQQVYEHYKKLWEEMNYDDNIERKRKYWFNIREQFNKTHNPLDFMFIMRTTVNGMPRYNKNGAFNNAFHLTRNGIEPKRLKDIIFNWSRVLNDNNVTFICCSYNEIAPTDSDFIYLDPPYANTKGMYFGQIDYIEFWNYLRNLSCEYIFSFNKISGKQNNTINVPSDIYDKHEYLLSGNSSFRRIVGKSSDSIVYESVYIKRKTN